MFSAETFIQFLPSGVDVINNPVDMPVVVGVDDQLVIDLSGSSTADGIVFGQVIFFFNLY